jgi:hypothetical protein
MRGGGRLESAGSARDFALEKLNRSNNMNVAIYYAAIFYIYIHIDEYPPDSSSRLAYVSHVETLPRRLVNELLILVMLELTDQG